MPKHHGKMMGAVISFVLVCVAVSTPLHSWAEAGGQGKAQGNSCMSQCMGFNAPSYDAGHELTQACQAQCNVGTGAGSCLASADGCCVPYTEDPDCPTLADVHLGFEDSAAVMCVAPLSPAYCVSQDVRVYNDGPVSVTVSVSFSGTYDETPENSFANHLINNTFCTGTDDGVSSWSASCTVENVPAGGSTFLARMWAYLGGSHAGSASVTTSSSPDPDTSNNTVEWNFTAPVP